MFVLIPALCSSAPRVSIIPLANVSDRLRVLVVALALLGCLGSPISEVFDQWDQPLQSATDDTEANVLIVALCVGVAVVAMRALYARLRVPSIAHDEAPQGARSKAPVQRLLSIRVDIRPHAPPLRV